MFCIYSICRLCSKLLQNSGNLKYLSTQSFFCARYTSHIEKVFPNPHRLKRQASQATRCSFNLLASKDNHCCLVGTLIGQLCTQPFLSPSHLVLPVRRKRARIFKVAWCQHICGVNPVHCYVFLIVSSVVLSEPCKKLTYQHGSVRRR